jgi:hypothetical protein
MSSRTVNIYLLRATDGHSLLTTIVFVYKLFTLIYYAGDYLVLLLGIIYYSLISDAAVQWI